LGGDLDQQALRAARANLARLGEPPLIRWDARRLPLADEAIDRLICNLPFGVKLEKPEDIPQLYRRVLPQLDRVLRPGGRAVLLAADVAALHTAARKLPWTAVRKVPVRVLGQKAAITVFQKK
jgi:tRNA G10  N-methylase Trm11